MNTGCYTLTVDMGNRVEGATGRTVDVCLLLNTY